MIGARSMCGTSGTVSIVVRCQYWRHTKGVMNIKVRRLSSDARSSSGASGAGGPLGGRSANAAPGEAALAV